MHRSILTLPFILILMVWVIILPTGAAITLTNDDSMFLSDMTNEGIPLFYEIPAALKTGFFHGTEKAIATVGQEQSTALDTFVTRINGYTLSDDVKKVRDQYLASYGLYKSNLTEYSTLVNSCGSCISKMNEMYPSLIEEAKKTNKMVIQFYETSQAPIS